MRRALGVTVSWIARGSSAAALAAALVGGTAAMAQTTANPGETPAQQAGADDTGGDETIVVTGSRIARAGFDQPTPTTVIGAVELRQGARANIAQILNDQPQFRQTVTPTVSVGNTSSGTAPVDLRGLGTVRTLTLLNGRRFVAENNLNLIPSGLIERVEVVTGGASAAYGSGAVAGVVNIILNENLEGLTLGGSGGVSTRGDAQRYSLDGTFGTKFAGGAGHFMVGVEYVDDLGITDRNSRKNLGSAGIVALGGGPTQLVRDVNYTNRSAAGVVTAGALAGLTFNDDGTLRPFRGPNAQGIGGADGIGLYDDVYGASPFKRLNVFARASYDIGGAKIWVDGTYGRAETRYPFFPDLLLGTQVISATNAYVRPEIRTQLANAGQTSFTLGRVFNDIFLNTFDGKRENKEGAVGIDGTIGDSSWAYNAYYSHGELENNERMFNTRIAANYTRAINAVANAAGQIVCAVNADAIATNDDPACAPLNILGSNVASPAALNYVRGTQAQRIVSRLDVTAGQIQGDLLNLWAGPLTIAAGYEFRWERQTTRRDALTATPGYFGFPIFAQDLAGRFNVKEGFGEVAAPLIDLTDALKVDFNGAARYSDYSFSGGIWSWKLGGTVRVLNDILLRVTRSRDIRAPSISNLFSTRATGIGTVSDQDTAGRAAANPLYNRTPSQVFTYSGGNADLVPEVSKTLTFGGSISPRFLKGFQLSVDYYDINISDAIVTLNGSQLTLACANGSQAACDRIVRDATGTITTVFANAANIATFKTSGIDFEASYVLPLPGVASDATVRLRALATYVRSFIYNTGVSVTDFVGQVGNTVAQGVPEWRGTLSATYQDKVFGFDARVRYVDGGLFDRSQTTLVNNKIGSRTYVDLGAQLKVTDNFTFFGNVNNLFDVDPPLSTAGPVHYDAIGTYFTFGARAKF